MERRNFLRNAGMLGLAAVATNSVSAVEAVPSQISSRKAGIKVDDQWDIIVVGGGPAGCAAATAAAREGAKVLLIEGTGALGGMGTSGLLNAWCPFTDKEKLFTKESRKKYFWNR